VRQLRNDEVKYNIDRVGGDSVSSGGDADVGSAPGRVPAAGRQLSRQDAFKVRRADEALVEKAREAYDESGGGVAGMQVRDGGFVIAGAAQQVGLRLISFRRCLGQERVSTGKTRWS